MKIFTNLPRSLRMLFALLRALTIMMAAFWLLMFTLNVWIQKRYMDDPKVIVAIGDGWLRTERNAVRLSPDGSKPGSVGLVNLRGRLQVNLCSKDGALVSAVYWSILPALAVVTAFLWSLLGSLRSICANIERGEVFSEANLRLVRRIGWIVVANSLVSFAVALWAAHVMGGYLSQHVVLTGIETSPKFPGGLGAVGFTMSSDMMPLSGLGGLVVGCLVLMLSEAFRQGLALKSENDLTV